MDNFSLIGKVAIVTGSSSGIGKAIATLLIHRGAKVTLNGRNAEKLEKAADEIKAAGAKEDRVFAVAGDVTVESCRQDIVEKTVTHFGQLDILVNNAGSLGGGPLETLTEEGLDIMMNVLFKAPIFMSKASLPHLKKTKGCIVNTSSCVTSENYPGYFPYTVAKHSLDKFTEYAALEFRSSGIRVNAVKPGAIHTDIFSEPFKGDNEQIEVFLESQKVLSMLGRLGQPEDVAEMVAFLCSNAAKNITAHHFAVDGGRQHFYHH